MSDDQITSRMNKSYDRLRFIRSLTGLSRKVIAEKYGLPEVTLNKWETGALPISEKGVIRCLDIYKKEGVIVREEWILYGNGPIPHITDQSNKIHHKGNYKNFANDINYFEENYADCIVFKVSGDEMLPIYNIGDIVIGYIYQENYKELDNKYCIVTLTDNRQLLRKLVIANDKYHLHCINPLTSCKEPILFDVKIKEIASIIWHGITNH
ncbi:hypothetical protein NOVO_02075 [Rickettsiales bacterium Ac37b]|nr:hypothetical protein NOVO_02075 [Rickettsiales bacterium Ac37b]